MSRGAVIPLPQAVGRILAAGTRVIEIGARDDDVARELAARGVDAYLGLVEPHRLRAARVAAGIRAHRFHPLTDPFVAGRCSTDLVILRGRAARIVWALRHLSAVRWVAVERGGPETRAALAIASARGRLRLIGSAVIGGVTLDFFDTGFREPHRPRMYFSPVWGVAGLAERLASEGLDPVVLRWFDGLPFVDEGEDLDMLVRDDQADAVRALVSREPGTVPIDLYSETGTDGYEFRGAAYYVPDLARRILDRAVRHRCGLRVPAPDDYLYSLAYHALYHKGADSGLSTTAEVSVVERPDHDYRVSLADAALRAGIAFPTRMEDADDALALAGWRPPLDALRRLSLDNAWLRTRLPAETAASTDGAELAVFLVRERAEDLIPREMMTDALEHLGFEIVAALDLDTEARARSRARIRGGNWGAGPYPVTGGGPAVLIAALHYAPQPVGADLRGRYPHLRNADILNAKLAVREIVVAAVDERSAFNAMHSADDENEAWHYLEIAVPAQVERLRIEVERRRRAQRAPDVSVRTLSRGRRSRVDVVAGASTPAVRKTFTAAGSRHLAREVDALTTLAPTIAAVPPLLARGEGWFELPFYRDTLPAGGGLLPLGTVRRMVEVLRQVHDAGFDLVDAKPDNFVVDAREGLRVVDLEFAYPRRMADSFESGPTFHTPDATRYPDLPVGDSSYAVRWLPRTGLPVEALVHGSVAAQHLHRLAYRLRALTVVPGSPVRRVVRGLRGAAGRVREKLREAVLHVADARAGHGVMRFGGEGGTHE